jgi:hypothetical protein
VRSYLLGTLEETSAVSLEERYFTDRAFFLFVQSVETALIEDYLADRLAPAVRSRFERRYLSVPDLNQRLEEVRQSQLLEQATIRHSPVARVLLVAAIVLVCVGGTSIWLYRERMRIDPLPSVMRARPVLATLSLSPGLQKGEAGAMAQIGAMSRQGSLRLVLELPGLRAPIPCSVEFSAATPGAGWKRVWSTPEPVWAIPFGDQHQLVILPDASLFPRGDYLVEVVDSGWQIDETYYFRVVRM